MVSSSFLRHYDETKTLLKSQHQICAIGADGEQTGSTGLAFSDLATFDVRVFVNLEQRGNLAEKVTFFKGSRISIGVDNVFDSYRRVTDDSGQTPIGFQLAFIDLVGRFFEIDFRKRF